MSEQPSPSIPMSKVYEVIGQLYLQLHASQDTHNALVQQNADLQGHIAQLQTMINSQQTSVAPAQGNPVPPTPNAVDVLAQAQAAAQGVNAMGAPANEPNSTE